MTREGEEPDSGLLEAQTTGEDRVRMVARQLSEPRTVNWIASEADWSYEPTKRVVERLVDDGVLQRDESGAHTTYYPDYRYQVLQEAMRLRDTADTVTELTEKLQEMKAQVRDWEGEYYVDSPNELRATISSPELSEAEEKQRREIAQDWEHLERRIRIVSFAIREWDFLRPSTGRAEAGN
jgi:DNA-binding Lrp family transcriptional regulator